MKIYKDFKKFICNGCTYTEQERTKYVVVNDTFVVLFDVKGDLIGKMYTKYCQIDDRNYDILEVFVR